ncbi:mechanosensitive ion channel family protein [Roseobacter sp. HKCCA0434]|uniref:mechanosensitive ion channel family protein n=1 Tax=Roseobacter sp. HKCCA0434 TaxID=3079297 RepID=UPI002905A440|nr:mechanosensitive ion channel domain-containing protein [Roseobacter sp. HKCCA0434]
MALRLLVLLLLMALPVQAQDGPATRWYEIEAVNPGLPAPERPIDRSTPRDMLESFEDLTGAERFSDAAHMLDLSRLPEDRQAADGADLARELAGVMERRVWINWASVSARPDALVEDSAQNHPQAGQVRRNISIALMEARGRAYEIRIYRVKAEGEDPVWLFTPQTIDAIPVLDEVFGPRWFEEYLPSALEQRVAGLRLWEWIGLPLIALGAIAVGFLVHGIIMGIANRVGWPPARWLLDRAAVPLGIVAAAGAAQALLATTISFSGPVSSLITPALIIAMVVGVALAALRGIDAVLDKITERYVGEIDDAQSKDERQLYTSIYAARRIVVLVTVAIAIGLVLAELNLFASLGLSLLASAGVATVVLGIAGQTVLGNILASLQIAIAKPVRIGDSVMYEGDWAYVEAIFYTYIRLRTWDERRLIVPVKYFVSNPFENWSMQDARMVRTFTLVLDHMADVDVLREKFAEIAGNDDTVTGEDTVQTLVLGHGEAGMEVTFYAMAPDPSSAWAMHARLREAMIAFVRDEHPDWWPRERVRDVGEGQAATQAHD